MLDVDHYLFVNISLYVFLQPDQPIGVSFLSLSANFEIWG